MELISPFTMFFPDSKDHAHSLRHSMTLGPWAQVQFQSSSMCICGPLLPKIFCVRNRQDRKWCEAENYNGSVSSKKGGKIELGSWCLSPLFLLLNYESCPVQKETHSDITIWKLKSLKPGKCLVRLLPKKKKKDLKEKKDCVVNLVGLVVFHGNFNYTVIWAKSKDGKNSGWVQVSGM